MEINRAKIFFTCDSVYHYPVAKYFEVLACKTLLLAPASRELTDLGFIPGVNFVSIDESNFEEKAEYYLRHEEERLQIATKGYEMVHARHTTARRAAEFADILETILRQEQQST
jgi:spore maturation protein CgeB